MKKPKKPLRRELIEWGVLLMIILVLYAGGFQTTLRSWILATGLMAPKLHAEAEEQVDASYDLELYSLETSAPLSFSRLKGQTVFVNFWATWCGPCLAEMPDIQSLYEDSPDSVAFVMISVDEDPEAVYNFLENKGYTFPVYFLASALPKVYRHNSIPRTYVLSPEGKIVARKVGMAKYNTPSFRHFLSELSP